MGFVTYKNHASVVLDFGRDSRDRTWALRSCCFAVAGTTWHVLTANEMVALLAQQVGCLLETRPQGKLVITSNLDLAINWLTDFRSRLISHINEYDARRRFMKSSGKRFPVTQPFDRDLVLRLATSL